MRNLNPFAVWNLPITRKKVDVVELIQRGTVTMNGVTSTDATITSVDTSRTELAYLGFYTVVDALQYHPYINLSSATKVGVQRGSTGGSETVTSFEVHTRP